GDFTSHHADSGGDQRFAGHAAGGVDCQRGVQYGVRNLVSHLIGVTFSHGFRRENMSHSFRHLQYPPRGCTYDLLVGKPKYSVYHGLAEAASLSLETPIYSACNKLPMEVSL